MFYYIVYRLWNTANMTQINSLDTGIQIFEFETYHGSQLTLGFGGAPPFPLIISTFDSAQKVLILFSLNFSRFFCFRSFSKIVNVDISWLL